MLQRFRVTKAADVPSLIVKEWESKTIPAAWGLLQKKLTQRDKLVSELMKLIKATSAEGKALARLSSRWNNWRKLLGDKTFAPAIGSLPTASDTSTALADEKNDLKDLTSSGSKWTRKAIAEFLTALNDYLDKRKKLDEERMEHHRFDTSFSGKDVTTLLSAITSVTFSPADVKAVVGQETGDLTNVKVAGIDPKKAGIRTERVNRGGYVGLGQHSAEARDEATDWAAKQGVIIPKRPDPRTDPEQSIKLTGAYLGRVADLLLGVLPATKPTGDELKKMVFGAYNGGHNHVAKAAKSFVGTTPKPYTWDDIKKGVRGQTREYVADIITRLS